MNRKISRVAVAVAIGVGALALGGGVASADHEEGFAPLGGCPEGHSGFFLVSTFFIIEELDNGNFMDQNGDGLICVRLNKGQTAKNDGGSFTAKDNANPLQGTIPLP